eukprot:2031064-Alexandrium_andersonii.AAC.1
MALARFRDCPEYADEYATDRREHAALVRMAQNKESWNKLSKRCTEGNGAFADISGLPVFQ